jgi:hypothetical protein
VIDASSTPGTVVLARVSAPDVRDRRRVRQNLAVGTTGAPSVGFGVAIGSRLELRADVVLVAYAVMPSVRVRVAGDQVSLHLVGAVPINFTDNSMSSTFVAGAAGLAVRIRATPALALTLESLASFAAAPHGTTFPAFVGGELWV